MAEEQQAQEKTEDATARKLEKSREEGQVARSRELNSVAIVTFGALATIAVMPNIASSIMDLTTRQFEQAAQVSKPLQYYLGVAAVDTLGMVAPLSAVLFVAGVVSSVMVGGFVLSAKALSPKLERLSIIKGFGRMFSAKSAVELVKSIAKFVLIAGVASLTLGILLEDLLQLGSLPVRVAISNSMEYVAIAFVFIGLVLILVAAIDVPFQIAQHKKQLKMTKQEVKDEMKDSEGKPEVKAKIRALQQQVAQRQMLNDVPAADVIITNPEHYSIAIKYDSTTMEAPLLVAKGIDFMAMRIREVAAANEVPIVPAPPLARAIYYTTDVQQQVPEDLYLAIAQVLAYVYQLDEFRAGTRSNVPNLGDIKVPEGMDTMDEVDE
ncbi:MAG: flagellar biosynthesis protein FlhB [Pseudomonadales bacterium]|nr:flagellar biosynthesis protein FlhB [Pseudomonadales bacterium]